MPETGKQRKPPVDPEALSKLLAGDASIPAGRVENDEMTVVADGDAAGSPG